MKTHFGSRYGAAIFAAMMIIGCCLGSMGRCEKRRGEQRQQLDDALENWEGEGGAVMVESEAVSAGTM